MYLVVSDGTMSVMVDHGGMVQQHYYSTAVFEKLFLLTSNDFCINYNTFLLAGFDRFILVLPPIKNIGFAILNIQTMVATMGDL